MGKLLGFILILIGFAIILMMAFSPYNLLFFLNPFLVPWIALGFIVLGVLVFLFSHPKYPR